MYKTPSNVLARVSQIAGLFDMQHERYFLTSLEEDDKETTAGVELAVTLDGILYIRSETVLGD